MKITYEDSKANKKVVLEDIRSNLTVDELEEVLSRVLSGLGYSKTTINELFGRQEDES